MSILWAFLPITIMVVLTYVVFKFASKVRIWTPKRTGWIVLIYLVLGMISFIGIFMLPDNAVKTIPEKELRQAIAEEQKLTEMYLDEKFDEIPTDYLVYCETYEGIAEDIELTLGDNMYGNTRVSITWNDSQSNDIVVTYYETPLLFNRIDISKDVQPLTVKFEDNHFYISQMGKTLNYNSFQANLEMRELEKYEGMHNSLDRLIGLRILHLNVPKHFNIIDTSGWVD